MAYQLPAAPFDAAEAARNRTLRANQFRDLIVKQYRSSYDAMWQTPRTHGERALTMEQMQSVLDQGQATFADILTDSAGFVAYIASAYPEAMLPGTDDQGESTEAMLPERYQTSPYVYETTGQGIQLTSLKPDWEAQDAAD